MKKYRQSDFQNQKRTGHSGFTLIELLVVIAIIGILSAVVLASLSTARDRGNDSSVKANLNSLRTQAELYYLTSGNSSYGSQSWVSGAATSCTGGMFGNPVVAKALATADSVNGAGNVDCVADSSYYVAAATLPSGGYWCVDHTGVGKSYATDLPTDEVTACP